MQAWRLQAQQRHPCSDQRAGRSSRGYSRGAPARPYCCVAELAKVRFGWTMPLTVSSLCSLRATWAASLYERRLHEPAAQFPLCPISVSQAWSSLILFQAFVQMRMRAGLQLMPAPASCFAVWRQLLHTRPAPSLAQTPSPFCGVLHARWVLGCMWPCPIPVLASGPALH